MLQKSRFNLLQTEKGDSKLTTALIFLRLALRAAAFISNDDAIPSLSLLSFE
ncbi:hypothetical protein CWATWH8502_4234 [Crocosphaera watsonii WH 8502]|uniref:Uncharacterized protein n=4 Tax=Crocosphaera watsonii TaxID=263511 RepID=T2JJA5_CROWT|nr:hypothetical protein CWATWH0003_4147 [Crocosphaera watsonii WH 0003]CCQ52201.1 hypothetical protein CWATWH8502_4234 [Crocosphaera watsonii WH 8502]CCQ59142.1 hypothetical protein CWATWH0005_5395 [Crocosphaera watsonii WH 0005]CCQ65211.1 hypothetical protein CWATWH0402_4579 [Crocosphaera watsonii WH 0402]